MIRRILASVLVRFLLPARASQRPRERHCAADQRRLAAAVKPLAAPIKAGARRVPTLEDVEGRGRYTDVIREPMALLLDAGSCRVGRASRRIGAAAASAGRPPLQQRTQGS